MAGPDVDADPLDGLRATLRAAVRAGTAPVVTLRLDIELLDEGNQLPGHPIHYIVQSSSARRR